MTLLSWAVPVALAVAAAFVAGRWCERQMAAAEFRVARRAWQRDVAPLVFGSRYDSERWHHDDALARSRHGRHRKLKS